MTGRLRTIGPRAWLAGAFGAGVCLTAAWFQLRGVRAVSSDDTAGLLGASMGGEVAPDGFIWERSRGRFVDAFDGRDVVFLARKDGTTDIFRGRVRLSPWGMRVVRTINLTQSPGLIEHDLRTDGDEILFDVARDPGTPVSVVRLHGSAPAWTWEEKWQVNRGVDRASEPASMTELPAVEESGDVRRQAIDLRAFTLRPVRGAREVMGGRGPGLAAKRTVASFPLGEQVTLHAVQGIAPQPRGTGAFLAWDRWGTMTSGERSFPGDATVLNLSSAWRRSSCGNAGPTCPSSNTIEAPAHPTQVLCIRDVAHAELIWSDSAIPAGLLKDASCELAIEFATAHPGVAKVGQDEETWPEVASMAIERRPLGPPIRGGSDESWSLRPTPGAKSAGPTTRLVATRLGTKVEILRFDLSELDLRLEASEREFLKTKKHPTNHSSLDALARISLGVRSYNKAAGIRISGDTLQSFDSKAAFFGWRAGEVPSVQAGSDVRDFTSAVQLILVAQAGTLLPTAQKARGSMRRRAAMCIHPDGALLVSSTTFDSEEATTQALLDLGCSTIVALERGSQHPFCVHFQGESVADGPEQPENGHETTLLALVPSKAPRSFFSAVLPDSALPSHEAQ